MEIGLSGAFGLPVVKHVEMGQSIDLESVTTPCQKITGQIALGHQWTQGTALFGIVQVSQTHMNDILERINTYINLLRFSITWGL